MATCGWPFFSNMISSLLRKVSNYLVSRQETKAAGLSSEWLTLLDSGKAGVVRPLVKTHFDGGNRQLPLQQVLDRAKAAAWSEEEIQKLLAYVDFYSGNVAVGYERVVAGQLAVADYALFMTAAVHCYRYDRFAEADKLLRQFQPERAEGQDDAEFLAIATAIAIAGTGDIDYALSYADKAWERGLFSRQLAINAYPLYFEAARFERTAEMAGAMRQSYGNDPEVVYALSWVELARDYYPEGFRLAEVRYQLPEVARAINPSLLARPRWEGEQLAGKRILVHGEQGFGDIIMMARYLPLLRSEGADVIVDCRDAAASLLSFNFPDCRIVVGKYHEPLVADFDVWTGMMSLPFRFNTAADTVPATDGYLSVPPEQRMYWKERVAECSAGARGLRIGVAWSGNPGHRFDKLRSLPFDLIARHVSENPNIRFFALQTSVPDIHPRNLIDNSEEMLTLADTAALIDEMDLVITVDTSIVHLAGALGKKTWLLLPYRYEWRWSLEGESNPWYTSVAVLRQSDHGDWDGLLDHVFGHRLPAFVAEVRRAQCPG